MRISVPFAQRGSPSAARTAAAPATRSTTRTTSAFDLMPCSLPKTGASGGERRRGHVHLLLEHGGERDVALLDELPLDELSDLARDGGEREGHRLFAPVVGVGGELEDRAHRPAHDDRDRADGVEAFGCGDRRLWRADEPAEVGAPYLLGVD